MLLSSYKSFLQKINCVRGKTVLEENSVYYKERLQNLEKKNRVNQKSVLEENRVRGEPPVINYAIPVLLMPDYLPRKNTYFLEKFTNSKESWI